MVHSFALNPKALVSIDDLIKASESDVAVYKGSVFTSLAEQGPRVAFAKQNFPKMGEDYTAFHTFFPQRPAFETFNKDVPPEAVLLIEIARAMKVGDDSVFDRVELWSDPDESELLTVGTIRFGNDQLYFPIVQWLTPVHGIEILSHTTLDDIRREYQLGYQSALDHLARQDRRDRHARWSAMVGALVVPAGLIPAIAFLQLWVLFPVGILALVMVLFSVDIIDQFIGKFLCRVGGITLITTLITLFYILEQITPET